MLSLLYNLSYGNYIYHFPDCVAALANLCHKNVLGNVVHTQVTKASVEFYKARMLFALVFLILKSDSKAKRIVAIHATKIVVVGVLL